MSAGAGSNGEPQPPGFDDETTHEGATAMGFYNVQIGDMPYFTELAKNYAISDNYHQAKPRRIRPTVAGGLKLSSSAKCSTIGQRMSGAGNGSA